MPERTYAAAINEASLQMMEADPSVFIIGQGSTSPWYVGSTTKGLVGRFGKERVIDTPISEEVSTGIAAGAAMAGMRPFVIHPRMDFMLLAMDPLLNHIAAWDSMFGGRVKVPVTVRAIVNRGGEQAAQHSKSLQSFFAHVPGMKVVMPATPYDAKGLLVSALRDEGPVMYIDDRWLYDQVGDVPDDLYEVPIGRGRLVREGSDLTIVATSYMVREAYKAAELLDEIHLDAEVIDLRTIKPMDEGIILKSLAKTGRLLVADASWKTCGIASEIAALAATKGFRHLTAPVATVGLPEVHAPASRVLEEAYYPMKEQLVSAATAMFEGPREVTA